MIHISDKIKINKSLFINLGVILLFLSVNIYELTEGTFEVLFRKATLLSLFFCSIVCCYKNIRIDRIIFAIICIISGIINCKYIGNSMLSNQITIILYIFISLLLTDERTDERALLVSIYINIVVIMYRFMVVGLFQRVYISASNNYISVYLLLPTFIYYILLEKKEKKIELWTAAVVWFVCLLGLGRGGILTATILLASLIVYRVAKEQLSKKIIIIVVGIITLAFIAINLDVILAKIGGSDFLSRFQKKGFNSGDRDIIWNDYFRQASKGKINILFGGKNKYTIAATQFAGNLHNTYLQIHSYNGIFPLIFILFAFVKNTLKTLGKHYYIYCICLFSLVFRSLTDIIFWRNIETTVLFFVMFVTYENKSFFKKSKKMVVK